MRSTCIGRPFIDAWSSDYSARPRLQGGSLIAISTWRAAVCAVSPTATPQPFQLSPSHTLTARDVPAYPSTATESKRGERLRFTVSGRCMRSQSTAARLASIPVVFKSRVRPCTSLKPGLEGERRARCFKGCERQLYNQQF